MQASNGHATRISREAMRIAATSAPEASSSTSLVSQKSAAKLQVEHLVQQSGGSPYRVTEEMASAMKALIAENPTDEPGKQTLAMGQGTWEVFYAPHIASLSSTLGTKFQPIRYILESGSIASNVFYSSSIIQEGWLSSSGTLLAKDPNTVEVSFDKFWVDFGSTKLRPTLAEGDAKTGAAGVFDSAVQTIGRAAFFPQFALFPVRYLDSDMAVFTFPPLRDSLIAVRKVS
ncbi:g5315 [Coccomyxa viridis]|uniref:G5315 protein n=1 Tax=Coccomyxa viridis TaxID=1274662 RepID=A0ABP1FZC0_9CHLO